MDEETSHWIEKTWRPAIGVTYIVINIFDFIIFPILWTLTGFFNGNHTPYHPLTLEATGLFHMAFGAILGVAAWNRNLFPRGKESMINEPPIYDRYQDYSHTSRYSDSTDYHKPRIPPRIPYKKTTRMEDDPSSESSAVFRGESNG